MNSKYVFCIKRAYLTAIYFMLMMAVSAQKFSPKVGAYYFDGWSGTTFHITDSLRLNYPEREPKWGWITSSQEILDKQIDLAAEIGLSFFSFCWYPTKNQNRESITLNRALGFYKESKSNRKLKYCLLIANHAGFEIGPEEWDTLQRVWINELKHPQYLKSEGKPLLIFFEHGSLVKRFGSPEAVKAAFESLRKYAKDQGLPGVSVAICEGSPDGIKIAEACGADLITGYNYHSAGFQGSELAIPIEKMQAAEQKLWDKLGHATRLRYIPVSTVGWDPRPWATAKNGYATKPYFTGFSARSVRNSLLGVIDWIKNNPEVNTKEKIALLYAWNENGEGSWLTPGKTGLDPSAEIKQVLR